MIDPAEPLRRAARRESFRRYRLDVIRITARQIDRLNSNVDFPAISRDLVLVSSAPTARASSRREVNQVTKLISLFRREEGQTMAEYGVVLAVITLGVVLALTALSGGISGAINSVVGNL